MKLTIVGTGYVGLVTGACFAEMGNTVTCVDIDDGKVESLKKGIIPIHEPGLEDIVINNFQQGRLNFVSSLSDPLADASVYFIAVGTPPEEDGSADLTHVIEVARQIGEHINDYTVIVDKSTVPVGTAEKVRNAVSGVLTSRGVNIDFDVVSNPEFLKEGAAIEDFMKPDRIVVGTESERAREIMHELYTPFMRNHERLFFMGVKEAEMTKYAANTMLATKISFMNEISNICDALGVDVESVRIGIGSDSRIGYAFIYPGAGYGGSCFPKDVRALIHNATECKIEPYVLNAVVKRNEAQKHVLFRKITSRFGHDLGGHTFGIWGLAFKPGTDDMREAPSIILINELLEAGAHVKAYDPAAMDTARMCFPREWFDQGRLSFADKQYDAVVDIDALVLVTEWKPFRHPDYALLKKMMKNPVVFDGRNLYDRTLLNEMGFEYKGIGR